MSVISFYNLIKNYQIEIPVIQRDYAQGRDNTKAKDVRKSIVSSMIDSIHSTNKQLFFDFIYGRVESNNAGLEKKFIPFEEVIIQKASFTNACNAGVRSIGIAYYIH